MEQKKRWTKEEDKLLVQTISDGSYNLKKCFITVAEQTGRTADAVHTRWYDHVRFTPEGRQAMVTIGKGSTYTGKNLTERGKVKPVITTKSSRIWTKILTILKLK